MTEECQAGGLIKRSFLPFLVFLYMERVLIFLFQKQGVLYWLVTSEKIKQNHIKNSPNPKQDFLFDFSVVYVVTTCTDEVC